MIFRRLLATAALALFAAVPAAAAAAAPGAKASGAKAGGKARVAIARLDCGSILIKDFDAFFSDANQLPKGPRTVTDSCYVIRHMTHYLLWDTGLSKGLIGATVDTPQMQPRLTRSIVDQLPALGLKPSDIGVVGISHMHGDHTGQAADFAGAELVIGAEDFALSAKDQNGDPFAAWRQDGAKRRLMSGSDIDIFGDGSVVALNLPGHTPGHMALRVKLASGTVLLSGDLYHSTLAHKVKSVPPFNTNRADTKASMDRFDTMAANLKAKVIVQHEPGDIAKLAAYPAWSE